MPFLPTLEALCLLCGTLTFGMWRFRSTVETTFSFGLYLFLIIETVPPTGLIIGTWSLWLLCVPLGSCLPISLEFMNFHLKWIAFSFWSHVTSLVCCGILILRELSLFINTTWLLDDNRGTAIFHWLYFVPYFDCICWFLSGRILFGTGGKILWRQDPLEWAWTKQRQRKYCLLYSSGEMFKSVSRNLFTVNEQPIANVSLHLSFQLRIMYVKKYTLHIRYYA